MQERVDFMRISINSWELLSREFISWDDPTPRNKATQGIHFLSAVKAGSVIFGRISTSDARLYARLCVYLII